MSAPGGSSRVIAAAIPESPEFARAGLLLRLAGLAALFVLELIVVSICIDTQALDGRGGFIGAIGGLGPHLLQSLVAFSVVFLALGYTEAKEVLSLARLPSLPLNWGFLVAHILAMSVFAYLSPVLFGGAHGGFGNLVASAWIAGGVAGIVTALLFFIPAPVLRIILPATRWAWAYASAAAIAMPAFVVASKRLWKPATALTFQLVKAFLTPFVSQVVSDPLTKTLGTRKFSVDIAPSCSGMEGIGLMLVFGVLWLLFFHRDFRFPRALLLIPAGMGLMFLANSVRITALILIGNAGAPGVALGGFHSQAGWISFNALALALACVAHRVPWISARRAAAVDVRQAENPTAPYLLPFLAILAAGMLSIALSGGFESMYPLRVIAAAGALWAFRRQYARIDWRFGWPAVGIGALVFLLWIWLDRIAGIPTAGGAPAALASSPAPARIGWLAFRVLGGVVTVPIAEELAFRGFLLRRLIAADFESVSLRRWTWLAAGGSSLAFGLLHGNRWIAGTLAGLLYAGAQKRRGRIGEAAAAHAITNALIAAWVLWGGHWPLW